MTDEKLTWTQTRALIRSDMERMVEHMGVGSFAHRCHYALMPGFQALFWHRISRHFYLRGYKLLARLISLFALYLTSAEIPPTSSLGSSAFIAHACGVNIFARAGDRLTIYGQGGFGGGFGEEDIGAGPGYALVGNNVTVAFGARPFRGVRIGDDAKLGPGAQTTRDVPAGALVMWTESRIFTAG